MLNICTKSIRIFIYITSMIFVIAIGACDNSKPNYTILSVSEETWNRSPRVIVIIKVDKTITKSKLEKLLTDLLMEQYTKSTKNRIPKIVSVEAHYDDDPKLKHIVGAVYQAFGGKVDFVYGDESSKKSIQLPNDIYEAIKLQDNVSKSYDNNKSEDFIFDNIERNDPSCRNSMIKVKNKFGKPDELVEVVPGSATIIYREKRLSFTFEAEGNNCNITSSNF